VTLELPLTAPGADQPRGMPETAPPPRRGPRRPPPRELAALRAATEPLGRGSGRRLPAPQALAELLPGGLQRGWVIQIHGGQRGGTSLALALLAAASAPGGWGALVGVPELGLLAAAEAGVPLERCLFVPHPGTAWPQTVALALQGVDLVVGRPPGRLSAAQARGLHARARHHGSLLVLLESPGWPEPPEITLEITGATWHGVEAGHGHLRARRCQIRRSGRRAAGEPSTTTVWLPGPR
jgi:hypothetical protein